MFNENDHPRDDDGKFTDGKSKEYDNLPSATRIAKSAPMQKSVKEEKNMKTKDDFQEDTAPVHGSQEELNRLLGEEFTGVKGQAAVQKLLQEKRGHVKGAFHRDDIGDIDLFWGNDSVGLKHIIQQRLKEKSNAEEGVLHTRDVLDHINETVSNGVFSRQNHRGDIEFVYKGYGVAIAPTYHNNKITYLLTAYRNEKSEKNRASHK